MCRSLSSLSVSKSSSSSRAKLMFLAMLCSYSVPGSRGRLDRNLKILSKIVWKTLSLPVETSCLPIGQVKLLKLLNVFIHLPVELVCLPAKYKVDSFKMLALLFAVSAGRISLPTVYKLRVLSNRLLNGHTLFTIQSYARSHLPKQFCHKFESQERFEKSFQVFLVCLFPSLPRLLGQSVFHPLCHEDESSGLLQFKHSFVLDKFASVDPSTYPKVESWKLDGSTNDCCSWDGVECDHDTGHVIGLDLSSSFLHGSINSSSSLFNLVHLRRLNLADNDFNSSQIPTQIGSLSRLRSLNLSDSFFSGQIPWEISSLSKLAFLDLSRYVDRYSDDSLLKLEKPSLRDLVQNLTHLKVLNLREVNISSEVPSVFSNRSSLTHLNLESCLLNGEFPTVIFHLPNLQSLNVEKNEDLTGYLPEFHHSSRLESLRVQMTSFSGALPSSIGNLESLRFLKLSDCNFSGTIPDLVGNLTDLSYLNIGSNKLVGQIPSWLGNLTGLIDLDLSVNQLHGMIPSSIYQLEDLEYLNLGLNNLGGKVELDIFLKLPHLRELLLSFNNLTVLATNSTNATHPKFIILGLSSCNLGEFPDFLHFQNELEVLFFSNNQIHGQIPLWLWNITKENMHLVDLSENFLTGFEKSPDLIPWQSLIYLDLSFNQLQGSLLVPPPSTAHYRVANNSLSGEISPSICHNSSLSTLVLSYNNLNGRIPQCLANSSEALSVLNLHSNNFHGIIPQAFANGIKMIDLSENQLHGPVPPSLANCTMLQTLVLGNNRIEGTFPFFLGALSNLRVLILRFNKFHGIIENPEINLALPKLRIIDLSHNEFSGNLPSNYFKNWNAMKMVDLGKLTYMQVEVSSEMVTTSYSYSITIAQKGTQRVYEKIQSAFVAIDLSNNKFSGEIPESLGSLRGLQVLNISNNNLTGAIPSSLASLTALESLDLSRNELSGKIPQQLIQLTFLAVLNVSNNNLKGRIPRGKQFDTFENSSYDGNPGLCGVPLSTSCENPKASPPPPLHSSQKDETGFTSGIYWMVIFMGYGSGLIVGLVIGTTLTRRYHEWFVETFGRKKKIQKKQKRRERRN
ncbi:receptor-like protein 7 [Rhododendron vialii]|uniref:receptor-like protein 7 n=1 Tax=Rhododendron vialii TaxID=182163 RepID=UPI00265FDF00|nr:receptor-like protein 7 [Rhododendron vialii]